MAAELRDGNVTSYLTISVHFVWYLIARPNKSDTGTITSFVSSSSVRLLGVGSDDVMIAACDGVVDEVWSAWKNKFTAGNNKGSKVLSLKTPSFVVQLEATDLTPVHN
ncbi:hypothetical protein KIN20_027349 [Parelaphostrongylus tenuis]|uniref:Uncharacterized protein n=1 Tax=Parelaphostrongylus tenuis TaxID=148309 RepID=A0AAD5QZA4_PARTN|nr:hypothetical protein KIN20_027349 [Parelaphostrongylus tenuis]